MSQALQENMHDGGKRKAVKVHTLKDTAIDAGLQALAKLSEAPAPAVKLTARAAISMWIPKIIEEQARGTSLLRIYNDLRKATKLRISYRSFQNYVSSASKDAGLRPVKAKAEAAPARPQEIEPAQIWECDRCETDSVRHEKDGRAWWQCPACRTFWKDDSGNITNHRMNAAKKQGE